MIGPAPFDPRAVADLATAVGTGDAKAADLVATALERMGPAQNALNLFLATDEEGARAAAEAVDAREDAGDLPLAGVPIALKDNIAVAGMPTTCGSRILEGFVPPYEATAVRRLRAMGAVIVGKTNMDEFAMGSSNENSAYGPVRNPHDHARVPGGSSGGSAAAVAAGVVPAALGSETGGSVRQPASFCGIVGVKPTYGRVSRYGLVAFASSLDQIGAFGRTVADAAAVLGVIAGIDPLDATSADVAVSDYLGASASGAVEGLKGLVVGVPRECFGDGVEPGVLRRCEEALDALRDAGAELRDVSLPHTALAVPTYYLLAPAEASSNLARFDGVRYGPRHASGDGLIDMYEETRARGFGAEVKRRIMLGTYVLSAGYYDRYYGRAQRARERIAGDFRAVFDDGVDALFTPTSPTTAFALGERIDDPYRMYLADVFTATANLAGIPGISVPVGTAEGLPVGGQILAPHFAEAMMFRVAAALEARIDGGAANGGGR
ncbi:MAG TPA: Asp-tRNA(Asn)/Glu-tRNA(Gln) amidotransferase subunit GatA [Longimicrobiales bacterium]|nr:Asp-tRNA(Asn)/Glu-tRNA(Gln) amidotransferase subunit GatA [Longimicrobiales bacterium]